MSAKDVLHNALKSLKNSQLDEIGKATIFTTLSSTINSLGEYQIAVDTAEEALAIRTRLLGRDDLMTAQSEFRLANALQMQAKLPLAAELLEHVHKVFVDSSVENSSEAMISNNKLARTYHLMGRWDEAIARLRTSIQLVESGAAVDVEPGFLTVTKRMLGLALARAGKLAESEQLLKEILPEQTLILGAIHPETITTARALATQLFEKGEHQQALDQFEKHLGTASAMAGLGISYMAVGRSAEALDLLENALAIYKDVYVPGHVDTMVIMSTLGQSYIAAGKLDDATKILTEVQTLAETHLAADHPMQIAAISNLFTAHHKSGRYDEAVRLRERALAEKR